MAIQGHSRSYISVSLKSYYIRGYIAQYNKCGLRCTTKPLGVCYGFAAVFNLIFDYLSIGEGVPLGVDDGTVKLGACKC